MGDYKAMTANPPQPPAPEAADSGETAPDYSKQRRKIFHVLSSYFGLDTANSNTAAVSDLLNLEIDYSAAAVQAESRKLLERALAVAPSEWPIPERRDYMTQRQKGYTEAIAEYKANITALLDSEQQKLEGK